MALPTVEIISGRLGKDVEIRHTSAGKAVGSFTVASSSRKKNPDTGQWEDGDTTWTNITVWGELAENVANVFSKGQPISLKGRLKQRTYEKDGQNRTVFEVEADEVSNPVPRFKAGESGSRVQAASPRPANDPWANSAPQGGFSGAADNPPF